jgi:hypothetical protein
MLVSITEAARLAHKGRATLYRDIDKGRLSKTVAESGETAIDTSELIRVYGRLFLNEKNDDVRDAADRAPGAEDDSREASGDASYRSAETPGDSARVQILEERIRSLERIIELEADLRKVKDQVTDELRARLEDKNGLIKALESKMMLLEYSPSAAGPGQQPTAGSFWSRFGKRRR